MRSYAGGLVALMLGLVASMLMTTAGAALPGGGLPQQDDPTLLPSFRAGVDVVSLNVTVTDADNRFITDLDQDDFAVYEDGVQQEITFFNRSQLPIALSLLMDTSASMDERMRTAQEAAIGFAQRLKPDDLAEIIDFDSRVEILQAFTNDLDHLGRAIRRTSAGGSTSLYNALYISLKGLSKAPLRMAEVRRQANRRALGRRGHLQPAHVRGGARAGQALGDSHLHHRAAGRRRSAIGLPGSRLRAAATGLRNRRTLVLP